MDDIVYIVYGYAIALLVGLFQILSDRLERKIPNDIAVLARCVLYSSRHSEDFRVATRWLFMHADYTNREEVELLAIAICRNFEFFRAEIATTQKKRSAIRNKLNSMNYGRASNIYYALQQF